MNLRCVRTLPFIAILLCISTSGVLSQDDPKIQDLIFEKASANPSCDLMTELQSWLSSVGEVESVTYEDVAKLRNKRPKMQQLQRRLMSNLSIKKGRGRRAPVLANASVTVIVSNAFKDLAEFFIVSEYKADDGEQCGPGAFSSSAEFKQTSCPQVAIGSVEGGGDAYLEFTAPACGCVTLKGLLVYKKDTAENERGKLISPESTRRRRLTKEFCVREVRRANKKPNKRVNKGPKTRRQIMRAFRKTKKNLQQNFDELVEEEYLRLNGGEEVNETDSEDVLTRNDDVAGNKRGKNRRRKNKRRNKRQKNKEARARRRIMRGLNMCCRTAVANDDTPNEIDQSAGNNQCPAVAQNILSTVADKNNVSEKSCSSIHEQCCNESRRRDLN